jgi:hypothetical protein
MQMPDDTVTRNLAIALLGTACFFTGPLVRADQGGLDGFVGRWDVRVATLQPEKSEVTYTEVYAWVLDRQFLRGQTGRKTDGTEDVIYATYDAQAKGYPFWIFSSSGSYVYLAPATWNARTRIMEWKNPAGWDISYRGRCSFSDENTRHCTMIQKDWKGKVLLEQEWSAVRRDD